MIKWFYKISNTSFKQMFGYAHGNLSQLIHEWLCHKKMTFSGKSLLKKKPGQSTGFYSHLAFYDWCWSASFTSVRLNLWLSVSWRIRIKARYCILIYGTLV